MRVNIYAGEMTDRVEIMTKEIDGQTYTGVRIFFTLPATVNGCRPGDDVSSAVTFWGKRDLRAVLKHAVMLLDHYYAKRGMP